jgi:hypothetical protein
MEKKTTGKFWYSSQLIGRVPIDYFKYERGIINGLNAGLKIRLEAIEKVFGKTKDK